MELGNNANETKEDALLQDKKTNLRKVNTYGENVEDIRRNHSSTLISVKEKDIIEKIKKKNVEGQKNAFKKLIWVSVVCIIFMIVELVGGIISGSVAIQADAAHMLSDFSGFAISMISIIISRRSPTFKLSYGYHRAEVVGTLCSILLIWGLTAWLFYEALQKIVKDEKVDDPMIMLIVGIVGLLANIFMGHILHSAGGHHGHSHGGHGHSHGGSSKKDSAHKTEDKKKKDYMKKKVDNNKKDETINATNNAINNISTLTDPLVSNNESIINNLANNKNNHSNDHCNDDHGHAHDDHGHAHDDHGHAHDKNEHAHDKNEHAHDDHGHAHDKNGHADDDHGHAHDDHGCAHDEDHDEEHDEEQAHHENMNVRAAFIHVLGDLLQSVGVVLAAVAILIWPKAYIADPILTFLFSVIVLFTTIPVLGECLRVFMEGTPTGVNPNKVLKDLYSVPGVIEVHDLHIWALSAGNNALSVHIRSSTPMISLKKATRLINTKYKILRTTIQIESESDEVKFECESAT